MPTWTVQPRDGPFRWRVFDKRTFTAYWALTEAEAEWLAGRLNEMEQVESEPAG